MRGIFRKGEDIFPAAGTLFRTSMRNKPHGGFRQSFFLYENMTQDTFFQDIGFSVPLHGTVRPDEAVFS